uniref:hypothetical protein n=1 Tax=Castellaniella defragrans TaxID=75697 RepID=UPI003342D99C
MLFLDGAIRQRPAGPGAGHALVLFMEEVRRRAWGVFRILFPEKFIKTIDVMNKYFMNHQY